MLPEILGPFSYGSSCAPGTRVRRVRMPSWNAHHAAFSSHRGAAIIETIYNDVLFSSASRDLFGRRLHPFLELPTVLYFRAFTLRPHDTPQQLSPIHRLKFFVNRAYGNTPLTWQYLSPCRLQHVTHSFQLFQYTLLTSTSAIHTYHAKRKHKTFRRTAVLATPCLLSNDDRPSHSDADASRESSSYRNASS